MSLLPPKKYLDIASVMDARKLPLAVVIQKNRDIKVYMIDSENSRAYFNSFDDPLMPSINSVENASKSFGKEISQEDFLQASVFPAQTGCSSGNREYAIYRAKFEEEEQETSKKVCGTKSKICQ